MTKPDHARALDILAHRGGRPSLVRLSNGRACHVYDIAWGFDLGEEVAHITTNINPGPGVPCSVDFFHADEIVAIEDAEDGRWLFESTEKRG